MSNTKALYRIGDSDLHGRNDSPEETGRRVFRGVRPPIGLTMEISAALPDALGVSSYRLGKLLGVSNGYVGSWQSGRCRPSQALLARMLKVAVDALSGIKLERIQTYDWRTQQPIFFPGWEPSNET